MPTNKRKQRQRSSKRATGNQLGPPGTVVVPRGPSSAALPIAFETGFRYFTNLSNGSGGANLYSEYVFRSNSLYDPDFTGVGVQPAGFAALATLYNKYRVLAVDVKLTIVNDAGGSTTAVFFQRAASTSYSNVITASSQGFADTVMLSDQTGGKNQHVFRVKVKPWEVLGVSQARYMADDQFAASVTGNPAVVSYMGVGQQAITVAASVQFQLEARYVAVMFDRVTLV